MADADTTLTDETQLDDAADETVDDPEVETPDTADKPDPEGADELGDAGKRALDAMKEKWKAERDKRREVESKLAEHTEADEPDPAAEAVARANQRIIRSEIKAAAAGKLADATDAYKFIDLDTFEVDDDGNVDEDEIADAIDDLIRSKPYLAAQGGRRFKGGADGGTRKESGPKQLTQSDLDRMTPEEIVKAKNEGRFDTLLGKN